MAGLVLGVDLGQKGALVALAGDGRLLDALAMPLEKSHAGGKTVNVPALYAWLLGLGVTGRPAALEAVGAFGRDGRKSVFTFGRGTGLVEAALRLAGARLCWVPPREWQAAVIPAAGVGKENKKAASLEYAARKWPALAATYPGHHGVSDAACLAEYARRLAAEGL